MNCVCQQDDGCSKVVSACRAHVAYHENCNAGLRKQIFEERRRLMDEAGKKAVDLVSVHPKDIAEAVQTGILIGRVRALEEIIKKLA